jgi:hypothetical protein
MAWPYTVPTVPTGDAVYIEMLMGEPITKCKQMRVVKKWPGFPLMIFMIYHWFIVNLRFSQCLRFSLVTKSFSVKVSSSVRLCEGVAMASFVG